MAEKEKLCIIWSSADKDVATSMVFMYTLNSKLHSWFKTVRLVVWGPSSKLLSEDSDLQDYIATMKEARVELQACKACADMFGVSDDLTNMGIDVKYMGLPLTEMLKGDWATMYF